LAPDVRLSGLRKEFDSTVAVDDVELEIEHGEFFTLLGPSGSGTREPRGVATL
jgi:ABC-type Fe3+/spermidine/putrescine transport system ATPase subunit